MDVSDLQDELAKHEPTDEVVLVIDDEDYAIDSVSHDGIARVLIIQGSES